MRRRSLVRQALTKSAAPGPDTEALPRWLTSKMPTRSRTAVCSATTPPPGYSIGIVPAAEVGHLGAEGDVAVVQG